jgi:hypothetical protein
MKPDSELLLLFSCSAKDRGVPCQCKESGKRSMHAEQKSQLLDVVLDS